MLVTDLVNVESDCKLTVVEWKRRADILREIERMVEFCLRAIGLKQADDVADLEQFLEENCELITGLPLKTLLETEAQKLVMLLYHPGTAKLNPLSVPEIVCFNARFGEGKEAWPKANRNVRPKVAGREKPQHAL